MLSIELVTTVLFITRQKIACLPGRNATEDRTEVVYAQGKKNFGGKTLDLSGHERVMADICKAQS